MSTEAITPLLARFWGNFLRFVPLFPTAVATPLRGIGGHPVANFRTEVQSVENNVRCTSWGFGNFKIRNGGHCLLKIPHTLRKLWKVPQQRSLFIEWWPLHDRNSARPVKEGVCGNYGKLKVRKSAVWEFGELRTPIKNMIILNFGR
jgi:hypothetical protein